ncbi:MAG: hypothetical protein AAF399_13045 [Bacteroidota bacterium]
MELEDLKYIWQEHAEQLSAEAHQSPEEIGAMLQQRSQFALEQIQSNVKWEAILLGVVGIACGILLQQSEAFWRFLAPGLLLFVVLALGFYAWKSWQLRQIPLRAEHLRESLEQSISVLNRYMRWYQWFSISLVPLLGVGGVLYGVAMGAQEQGATLAELSWGSWAWVGAAAIGYGVLSIWFARWYVQRLYGQHRDELKACLEELI